MYALRIIFEDGQLRFDYRMRPGVVAKSNALALMRSVGLGGLNTLAVGPDFRYAPQR